MGLQVTMCCSTAIQPVLRICDDLCQAMGLQWPPSTRLSVHARVQAKLVLLATAETETGRSSGLCPLGSKPLIRHWAEAVKNCARLLPPRDKVYIVTTPTAARDWCDRNVLEMTGLAADNILVYQDTAEPSAQQALTFALDCIPSFADGYVVVASLAHFFGLQIPLQQILEHTIVRGKTTITYCLPAPGTALAGHGLLSFDESSAAKNPRVTDVRVGGSESADGVADAVLAPFMVIRPTDLHTACQTQHSARNDQFSGLAQAILDGGAPLYALPTDVCLECSTDAQIEYTAGFVEFHLNELDQQQKRGPAAVALEIVTATAQESGAMSYGNWDVVQLMSNSSAEKQSLLKYSVLADNLLASRRTQSLGMTGKPTGNELPARFKDASTLRHMAKKQHPVYETTANEIGRRTPSQCDLPDVYAGNTQCFSNTFAGPYKAGGLTTGITRSKVHRLLDDF